VALVKVTPSKNMQFNPVLLLETGKFAGIHPGGNSSMEVTIIF
jgi:hypothetical protein